MKPDPAGWLTRFVPGLPALLVVAAVYACSLHILPSGGFWINDNASKFLQMRSIVAGSYRDYSITLPGGLIDPDLAFNPLPAPYFHISGKKVYSQYSVVFALLSSLPYHVLGHRGLYFLPVISSLLMLAGCARIAVLLGADRRAAGVVVAVAALATPTWFYSLTFWEHTPAACLLIWGLYHLLRSLPGGHWKRVFLGNLFLALAVAFRDELYLFIPVVFGAVLFHTRVGRRAAAVAAVTGGLAGIIPLWLLQWWALGTPLGFHLESSLPAGAEILRQIAARPVVFHDLFLAVGNNTVLSVALTAPFLAAMYLSFRRANRVAWIAPLAALAALCGLVFLGGFSREEGIMPWLMASNSMWPAAPVLILAFLAPAPGGRKPCRRTVLEIALIYALAYGIFTPDWRVSGLHSGNRLLYSLYPLLAIPAGVNLTAAWRRPDTGRWLRRSALAAVTAVSLGAQLYSLWLLDGRLKVSQRINHAVHQAVAEEVEVVLSDLWWIPQELYTMNHEHPVFLVRNPQMLSAMLKRLCTLDYRQYLLVTSRPGLPPHLDATRVEDTRFGFFTVDLVRGDACEE